MFMKCCDHALDISEDLDNEPIYGCDRIKQFSKIHGNMYICDLKPKFSTFILINKTFKCHFTKLTQGILSTASQPT